MKNPAVLCIFPTPPLLTLPRSILPQTIQKVIALIFHYFFLFSPSDYLTRIRNRLVLIMLKLNAFTSLQKGLLKAIIYYSGTKTSSLTSKYHGTLRTQ